MNQNPEQLARDQIDIALMRCGWLVQNTAEINLNTGIRIAVQEYRKNIGPADYVLFVDGDAVGIIEAKRAEQCVRLSYHGNQSEAYAKARLKYIGKTGIPSDYESTGDLTRFSRLPRSQTKT